MDNVGDALFGDYELWQRMARFGGWQDWQLGIKEEEDNILTREDARLLRRKNRRPIRKTRTRSRR